MFGQRMVSRAGKSNRKAKRPAVADTPFTLRVSPAGCR